jgi:hypothetical protein
VSKPRPNLITLQDYRIRYQDALEERGALEYFDSYNKPHTWMLPFSDGDMAPGCPWPSNYGMVTITDYSKHMVPKGRKKIVHSNGDVDYEDQEGMDELVPYKLKTTMQNIADAVKRKRYSCYSLPHRFLERYQDRLKCRVNGDECQGDQLTEEMLAEALSELTPFERSKYEQLLYRIDVSLYISVEQPVMVCITGIDDGAEQALFADFDSAYEAFLEIARWNTRSRREQLGFQSAG